MARSRSANRPPSHRPDERSGAGRAGRARERPRTVPGELAASRPSPPPPRRDTGTWLWGRHAVSAALLNPARRGRRIVALPEAQAEAQAMLAGARCRGGKELAVEPLDRARLAALLPEGAVHQGIALQSDPLPVAFLEDVIAELGPDPAGDRQSVVVLDRVSDPHNVGAVLRSAAAFGARAVILPEHGTPPASGALAKAASGALEHVPLLRVVNLARALDKLKQAGFWTVGLDEQADKALADIDLSGRVALVLGAEGEGLRRLTRERCDFLARLPTRGAVSSLNVSNAAAIALYELARSRPR